MAKDAYRLGEDVAEAGNVVISREMRDAISADPAFDGAAFSPLPQEDGAEVYVVSGRPDGIQSAPLAAIDDMRFLPPQVQPLLSRHAPSADLQRIDGDIDKRYMEQRTVLMFEIDDFGETGERLDRRHTVVTLWSRCGHPAVKLRPHATLRSHVTLWPHCCSITARPSRPTFLWCRTLNR